MSGIFGLANGILLQKNLDGIRDRAAAAAAAAASKKSGGGGGGTAVPLPDDPVEKARKADHADQMFERGKYAVNGLATQAFDAKNGWETSQSVSPSVAGSTSISPLGAGGNAMPTDQNGLVPPTPMGQSGGESSGSQPLTYDKDDEEDQSTGYDTASNESGGEAMATGGRVRAGGLYHVAEGGKDELYVQDDGDTFPLTDDMRMRPRESGVIVPNPEVAKMARAGIGNRSASPVSDKEYRRQLQEVSYRRNEIDRRAKSGELDALPSHYLTQDERSSLAPIQAKREADTKKAAAQAREEIGRKNPYALAPERDKAYAAETERTRQLAEFQSDPRTRQDLLNQAYARQRGTDDVSAKARAIDTANDPYVKIQNEQEKERQRILEEQQKRSESAISGLAREYIADPDKFSTNYGKEAASNAAAITKNYTARQFGLAGVGGVTLDGDAVRNPGTFSAPPPPPPGAPAASQPTQAGSQTASASAQGGGQPAASRPTPQPAAPAEPPKFNPVAIADHLRNPKTSPEARAAIIQGLGREEHGMVATAMDRIGQMERIDAESRAKPQQSTTDFMATQNKTPLDKVVRFFKGDPAQATPSAEQPDQYQPNMGERLRSSLSPAVEQASASVRSSVYPSERSPEPSQDWEQIGSAISGGVEAAANELGQSVPSMDKGSVADRALRWVRDPYGIAARDRDVASNPRASLGR